MDKMNVHIKIVLIKIFKLKTFIVHSFVSFHTGLLW
jgi:hypothetical protein